MRLTLRNEFTNETIMASNVTAFFQEDDGTTVYTELNGNNDMTTYRFRYVIGALI